MKVRYLLLLGLFVSTATPLIAQNRFSVGITAAPVLSHSHSNVRLTVPDQTGQPATARLDLRSSIGGFTAGVSVQYNFSPRWSLSTGLWFNQLRTTQPSPFTPATRTRVISSGYQIPLLVNYRLSDRRLSPVVSAGALGYLRNNTRYKPLDGGRDFRVKFGNSLNVQAIVGAGASYQLTPRWSLLVQPQLIWQFRPKGDDIIGYDRYVSYQLQGQVQLAYTL